MIEGLSNHLKKFGNTVYEIFTRWTHEMNPKHFKRRSIWRAAVTFCWGKRKDVSLSSQHFSTTNKQNFRWPWAHKACTYAVHLVVRSTPWDQVHPACSFFQKQHLPCEPRHRHSSWAPTSGEMCSADPLIFFLFKFPSRTTKVGLNHQRSDSPLSVRPRVCHNDVIVLPYYCKQVCGSFALLRTVHSPTVLPRRGKTRGC